MLNIPHVTRVPFKRHFIDRSICELRFEMVEGVDWGAAETKFKNIAPSIGLPTVKKSIESMFQLPDIAASGKAKEINIDSRILGLIGASQDGKLTLEIRSDRTIVTSQNYKGFTDFWDFIEKALPVLEEVWGIKHFKWIGIRKINVIGIVSADGNYEGQGANPLVYAPLRQGALDGRNVRLAESHYVLSDDSTTCNVKTRSARESDPTKINLMIDLDVNKIIDKLSNIKKLRPIAEELNGILYDVFYWATDPELIEHMKRD